MCGIAGFVGNRVRRGRREILQRMTDSLLHRGPDDEGTYLDDHVALGARRLAVIDRATGRQPIANEDGTVHVVLNGEIYNFADLRARLEHRGHRFRTRSDAEVIVHAYEETGEDCVRDLDGMFAFALWDVSRRRLLLARDRMGEKPLYYYAGPDILVFGSELRALLACTDLPRGLNLESLSRYLLFECVPSPHSILTGIAKLPPGHTLLVSPGDKVRLTRYWEMRFALDHSVDDIEWLGRLRTQLDASVKSRLVSDVPLGAFVSGGIDSGTIAALTVHARGSCPLQTFHVGFKEPAYDERAFARQVADHCGTEHHAIVFTGSQARSLMDGVGDLLDEPLVDGSFLPRYAFAQIARGSVVVVLSGDGGDELFCGYPTFLADRAARWLQRFLPPAVARVVGAAMERLPTSRRYGSTEFLLKQFFRGLPYEPGTRTQLLLGGLTPLEQARLLSPGVRRALQSFDPYAELRGNVDETSLRDPVERMIATVESPGGVTPGRRLSPAAVAMAKRSVRFRLDHKRGGPDECDHGTSGSNDRLAGHRPGSRKASGASVRPRRTRDRLRTLFRPSGSRNARLSDVCLRPATFLRRHERWRRDRCERWQRDSWGGATSSCSSGNRRRPNEVSVMSAEYGATTHSSMEMAMRSDDARCPRGGSR